MRQSYEQRMHDVKAFVGDPPRGIFSAFRRRTRLTPPRWLKPEDLIARIYQSQRQILRDGRARWAAIVQANALLFRPGLETCPSQIVYSPDNSVPLPELMRIAGETFALKDTKPVDPAARRIADMLTDERERALDWPLPRNLTNGRNVVTTVAMIQRDQVPGGFLGMNYFPIVADPTTSMALLIPSEFWPEDFWDEWKSNTDSVPIAQLTPRAAAELRRRAKGKSVALEVRCVPKDQRRVTYKYTIVPPGRRCVDHRVSQGIRLQFPDQFSLVQAVGMVIDYRDGTFGSNKALPRESQ